MRRPISPRVSAVKRQSDDDRVDLAHELVDRLGRMQSFDVCDRLGDVALHADHAHPECVCKAGDLGTDLADADDEHRSARATPRPGSDPSAVPPSRGAGGGAPLVNASSPSSAHSASGTACTPLALAIATRSSSAACERRRTHLLAGAGSRRLHEAKRSEEVRTAQASPSAVSAGMPKSTSAPFDELP